MPFVISAERPGDDQPPPRRGDGERERDMRPEKSCSTRKGVVAWRGVLVVDEAAFSEWTTA